MIIQKDTHNLTHEQKISFVLLLVFGIVAIGLGVLKIRNTLYKPFALSNNIPSTIKMLVDNVNYLQYRDTDKDGLTDFEELYVYKTSPYVADTDSDGVDDKTELGKGDNPNCASGKQCGAALTWSSVSTTGRILSGVANPGPAPADINLLLKDPKQLRAALVQSGVDQKLLSQINDTQLLQLVAELMSPSGTIKYATTSGR